MPVKALGEIEALPEQVKAVLCCVICILNTEVEELNGTDGLKKGTVTVPHSNKS